MIKVFNFDYLEEIQKYYDEELNAYLFIDEEAENYPGWFSDFFDGKRSLKEDFHRFLRAKSEDTNFDLKRDYFGVFANFFGALDHMLMNVTINFSLKQNCDIIANEIDILVHDLKVNNILCKSLFCRDVKANKIRAVKYIDADNIYVNDVLGHADIKVYDEIKANYVEAWNLEAKEINVKKYKEIVHNYIDYDI